MRKLFIGLVFGLLPAQADAQFCYAQFQNHFTGPINDTYEVSGYGSTRAYDYYPGSYSHWASCLSLWFVKHDTWVEGRQPDRPWGCDWREGGLNSADEATWKVCSMKESYPANGARQGVRMVYQHGSFVTGQWGLTTNHFYNSEYVQRRITDWYGVSYANECSMRGQPWYWNGSDCIDGGGSPILLPLRSNKEDTYAYYRLTAPSVHFDLDGDGDLDFISWPAAGSNLAFLAMDRNGNGTIDNGKELFGNYTLPGAMDGFRALSLSEAQADDGRQNAIDMADSIYPKLLLWEDRNSDGKSQPAELRPLSDVYAAIGTGYSYNPGAKDQYGNGFYVEGWAEVRTGPGLNRAAHAAEHFERLRRVYDVFFVMQ